jgi:hypothetical protein
MLFLYHNYSSTILTMFTLRTEILTNLLSEVFYYYHVCPFYSSISMPYNKYKFFLLNWWVCFCFLHFIMTIYKPCLQHIFTNMCICLHQTYVISSNSYITLLVNSLLRMSLDQTGRIMCFSAWHHLHRMFTICMGIIRDLFPGFKIRTKRSNCSV